MEAVVVYEGTAISLSIHSFSDLQTQVQAAFHNLPRAFRLIARGTHGELQLDSQVSFQQLRPNSPLHITIQETARRPVSRTQGRVRLANLAYLTKYGTAKDTEEEVRGAEEVPLAEMCPICMERWKRPMKAKCGHVCCLSCWERALAQYLECPLCRSHVRLKTLRPLPCTSA